MKTKYLWGLAVLAIAAAGIWYFSGPEGGSPEQQKESPPAEQKEENSQETVKEVPNSLEGELKVSSDKRRGNLMLLLKDSDRIIYLNTSRDFSSLIGKQVTVTIDGSLDDFRLVDITSASGN